MEGWSVQSKRPNEIKKATKAPEERRKEVEVRIAAARLLQQKSKTPSAQNEGDRGLDSSGGSGRRGVERRKHGKKNGSSMERKDRVWSYWNTLSVPMKKEMLRIRISDIKADIRLGDDEGLSEALEYAENNKMWKHWVCCGCSEKFPDPESHMQHVVQELMGNNLTKMQSVLLQNVDSEWAKMILNCSRKGLDLSAVVKTPGDRQNCQGMDPNEKTTSPIDDTNFVSQEVEIKVGDASCLMLDESLLPTECTTDSSHHSGACDASRLTSCKVGANAEALLSWMYAGPSSEEALKSWVRRKEEKTYQGMEIEILQMLEDEFHSLQELCDGKCKLIIEALQALEDPRIEEAKKRENADEFVYRSFVFFLRKGIEELKGDENDLTFTGNKIESEVIESVLREAEVLIANRFGYDDAYSGAASHLCDLRSGEDEDWRTKDYVHQDTCIKDTFQKQKEEFSTEV